MKEVTSATGYLAVEDAGDVGEVIINTHIDDAEVETMLTTKHIDASPTLGEVDHLLPGDFAWRDADPFMFDAMIATQKKMAGMRQRGSEGLLGKAYLHSQRFKTPQRTFGLVEIVNLLLDEGPKGMLSVRWESWHEELFDFDRDAADHEDDLIGMLGNVLIHPTLKIRELALEGIGAHTTRTNLVGHEDEGGILRGEAVKLGFESIKNS